MIIDGVNKAFKVEDKIFHCGIDVTMSFIGGKWKCVVLWYLRKGKKRFSELRRHIPDITEKMLSIQLKALEESGIIKRAVFGDKPPIRVEYSITDFGSSLLPAIELIAKWGREHGEEKGEVIDV